MAADQGLIDSVANENTKVGAGAPAYYAASVMQGHAAHMNRLNIIAEQALQNALAISSQAAAAAQRAFVEMSTTEALSNAIIGQTGVKATQSTPPETATPTKTN